MLKIKVIRVEMGKMVSPAVMVEVEEKKSYTDVMETAGIVFDANTMSLLFAHPDDSELNFVGADCEAEDGETICIYDKALFTPAAPADEKVEAAPTDVGAGTVAEAAPADAAVVAADQDEASVAEDAGAVTDPPTDEVVAKADEAVADDTAAAATLANDNAVATPTDEVAAKADDTSEAATPSNEVAGDGNRPTGDATEEQSDISVGHEKV
ncbi:MAG: hypothetical protein WC289_00555 [Patescibacteria group bacterium]|jgi:hypothetical protein